MTFASLGLSEDILRAVTEHGYTQPTPIQLQAIPAVLSGGDLLAGAQTGTGKTAGFTLPILQLLSNKPAANPGKGRPRCLVLTPTRELAAQVEESVKTYGKYVALSSTVIFGGVNANPQITRLKKPLDILVATPGRLLDHANQKNVDLSGVEILVLDEADRMLDMGFIRDIKKILALLPKQRQNLLFSATFSDEIKALTDTLLHNPALIEVARRNATAELIAQRIVLVDRDKKRDLLAHLIKEHNWFQVLVFTRTKHGANRLAEQLDKAGIPSLAIHGNKSQAARTRALKEFKDGSLQVLVATDIAARGIDIVELPHVVNFELPHVPEDYVHRIGRTGRAGVEGEALSLVCVDEHKLLKDIERVIKREFPRETVPGFEPDLNARPEPIVNGQGSGQGRGQGRAQNQGQARGQAHGQGQGQRHGQGQARQQTNGQGAGRNASRSSNPGAGRRSSPNPNQNPNQNPNRGVDRSSERNTAQRQDHGQNRSQPRSNGNGGDGVPREVDGNRAAPPRVVDGNRAGAMHRSGGRHR